jgi:hypothetical protein
MYNVFFTSYACIALADAGSEYARFVSKACKWLRAKQLASGAFGDIGSSLMAMAALQRVHGRVFTVDLPIPTFLRIQATLGGMD